MVIIYNDIPKSPFSNKKYKNNKHKESKISNRVPSKQLTTENKIFLTSLGLKVIA